MISPYGNDFYNQPPNPSEIEVVELNEIIEPLGFYDNLALSESEETLERISSYLLECIDKDIASRKSWEETLTKGMELCGLKLEEFRKAPYEWACGAFDSTLLTALVRSWSVIRSELLPASGPARDHVDEEHKDDENYDELCAKAKILEQDLNKFLTRIDKGYYSDFERMLLFVILIGCSFKKVYLDPVSNNPKSRFIEPQDFIVNAKCTHILDSDRLTHREYLTKKEILLRQKNGFYRKVKLDLSSEDINAKNEVKKIIEKIEGFDNSQLGTDSLYTVYEVHADLDLDGFRNYGMDDDESRVPLPYIISICLQNRKVLSIRRNCLSNDETFKRIESFVGYNYFPGFGIYGFGIVHLVGNNSIALTTIERQLIDAGTLNNFPGGVAQKGLKVEKNNILIGPSEFATIDTGGVPIDQAFQFMPYKEPSAVLNQLKNELKEDVQKLLNTSEMQMFDAKAETPVGTTLAMIEVANRLQSATLRTLHVSLTNELELITKLFIENSVHSRISPEEFDEKIRILPVSDPSMTTSTQRILRAEALLRLAQSAPDLHNMRHVYFQMYKVLGIENIDRYLNAPQDVLPLDPVTENAMALRHQPIKAARWQEHEAHILCHQLFLDEHPDDPQFVSAMIDHIKEHENEKYILQIEQIIGRPFPPIEELQDPQLQNVVAIESAKASIIQKEQLERSNPTPPDPNTVMMADIEARKEAEQLKLEIARLKAETDSYKAMLKFETDKRKIESDEEKAEERNDLDLTLAEMRLEESKNKSTPKGD